jgi:large subunit ribosomal protein L7/L12
VEQTEFQVILMASAPYLTRPNTSAKIRVIKVVHEITGLGLKQAKDLVDGVPGPVKQGINRDEAESIIKKLKAAGAEAEIR